MNSTSRRKIAITAIGTAMAGALCLGTAAPAHSQPRCGVEDPSLTARAFHRRSSRHRRLIS